MRTKAPRRKRRNKRSEHHRLPPEFYAELPLVAIVGRPNVGKSTLFNRLVGERLAVVEDIAGVTRDRHYAVATIGERPFILVDTGGFDPGSDDEMKEDITHQVEMALEECDVVICVFDAVLEPLGADFQMVERLRQTEKEVFFVANKCDSPGKTHLASSLYETGVDHLFLLSALHGQGTSELVEALEEVLPLPESSPEQAEDSDVEEDEESGESTHEGAEDDYKRIPRIAIVGRPNAGKSSLVNRLIGTEKQIVDDRPGTTVDSIDTVFSHRGESVVLTDTAGIRKKSAAKKSVEMMSVFQAIRSMERSDVVILLVGGDREAAEQDAKIAGLAADRGRALVFALNKTDLLDSEEKDKAIEKIRDVLAYAPWAPLVPISAKTGRGTKRLIDRALESIAEHNKRVSTAQLNRFFEEVLNEHPPPTYRQKPVRLYFITQARVRPPTFVISTNHPEGIHFSYKRYVTNQIRKRFGFRGTPIRVHYRAKEDRRRSKKS